MFWNSEDFKNFFKWWKKWNKIYKNLKEDDKINISYNTINKILNCFRQAFIHYIKNIYKLNKLGNRAGTSIINIDENIISHINNKKI